MATYYVSSVSGDNTDGSTWAKAFTTVPGATAVATADGDIIKLDSAHSETTGAGTTAITAATTGQRLTFESVDRNGSTTTGDNGRLAGATITGANVASVQIASGVGAKQYFYGITFRTNSGSNGNNVFNILGAVSAANHNCTFDTCTFNEQSNQGNITIGSGANAGSIAHYGAFYNCSFVIPNATNRNGINFSGGIFFFSNLQISYSGASKPPALFAAATGGSYPVVTIVDSDLSTFNTTSGEYFTTATFRGQFTLKNCKLSSTPAVTDSGTWSNDSNYINLINCDSGNTKNLYRYQNSLGTITNNTSIYANDGQTVNSTHTSWQIVTTSLCTEHAPFITPWLWRYWNSTSSTTASLEINRDNATGFTDLNMWAEFDYVSGTTDTKGTLASTRNARPITGSGSTYGAGAATWTGTGGFTNENKQKVSSTFTPGQGGMMIMGRLQVGVASTTLYLDPHLRLA